MQHRVRGSVEGEETPHPAKKRGDPLPQGERVKEVRWLSAVDVQGCHGKPADAMGVMEMPPAVTGKFARLRADLSPAFDWLTPFDVPALSRTSDINSPPPKLG